MHKRKHPKKITQLIIHAAQEITLFIASTFNIAITNNSYFILIVLSYINNKSVNTFLQ